MIDRIIAFAVGFVVGAMFGFLVAAIVVASGRGE